VADAVAVLLTAAVTTVDWSALASAGLSAPGPARPPTSRMIGRRLSAG
jgi:hypothetical protein